MALADAVRYLTWGLRELTVGLRATYILLDEVNKKAPEIIRGPRSW
jgi:hypothetical protein